MAEAFVRLTVKKDGWTPLMKKLKELAKLRVTVGYQGTDATHVAKPGGATLSAIARYNEFGTIHIPARGFMRRGTKKSGRVIAETSAVAFKKVVNGKGDPVAAMGLVGDALATMILRELNTTRSWAAPNAPSTIAKKGVAFPPLDAGAQGLHTGLSWAVQRNRSVLLKGKPI